MKKNILFMIPILGISNVQVNNSNFIIDEFDSSEKIVNYLSSKIDILNDKLKEINDEIDIKSFKSYDIKIKDLDYSGDGKLIVFNDNNGYMVIGDKFKLYDLKLLENNPFDYIECDKLSFNTIGGYSYIKDNEEYSVNNDISLIDDIKYEGQDLSGDGAIKDTDKYIVSRYGTGFNLAKEGSVNGSVIQNMKNRNQYNYSVYTTSEKGEANCGLVSAYICIDYIAKTYFSSEFDCYSKRTYNPKVEEKSIYESKIKNFSVNSENLTKENLYFTTRKKCIELYGKVEDLSLFESSGIIENVIGDINYVEEVNWANYAFEFYKEIDSHRPLLWSTLSSETYGSHTMAVSGYKYYSKNDKWWIFDKVKTISFAEIQDGWGKETRYFDLNAYSGKIGGFARWKI